jgi:hypothetical protein
MLCENMNDLKLDALIILLHASSSEDIKDNLLHGRYNSEEEPYAKEYLPLKIEEERNKPIKMYHRSKSPDGKIFKAYEVPSLKKSWVNSPTKFKESIINKIIRIIIKPIWIFWCKEYKWLLGFIVILIGLYLTYLKVILNK